MRRATRSLLSRRRRCSDRASRTRRKSFQTYLPVPKRPGRPAESHTPAAPELARCRATPSVVRHGSRGPHPGWRGRTHEGQCDGADHCGRAPRLAQGCRDRLSNRQISFGPIASFSHVRRSGQVWASGGEGAGRETAKVAFARSVPASSFARCAARAPHALANSQNEELGKFIHRGYPEGQSLVRFARYCATATCLAPSSTP